MLISAELIECFKTVLERVLKLNVLTINLCDDEFDLQGETAITSLGFKGDYSGGIVLAINDNDVDPVYKKLLEVYNLDESISKDALFSEMLNMFGGNLVTEFGKNGINLDITPPSKALPEKPANSKIHSVRMVTEQPYVFKIYLYITV